MIGGDFQKLAPHPEDLWDKRGSGISVLKAVEIMSLCLITQVSLYSRRILTIRGFWGLQDWTNLKIKLGPIWVVARSQLSVARGKQLKIKAGDKKGRYDVDEI